MKVRWLDRRIAFAGPHLCLCLSAKEYDAALRHLGVSERGSWLNPHADATAHHLISAKGSQTCVVCLDGEEAAKRNPVEVAGLLVHEAVHAWQEYCERIGEHAPGREQEAYAIQSIAQELMAEYARRMEP